MNLKIFHPKDRRSTRGITGRYDKNPGALKQNKRSLLYSTQKSYNKEIIKLMVRYPCFGTLRMRMKKISPCWLGKSPLKSRRDAKHSNYTLVET